MTRSENKAVLDAAFSQIEAEEAGRQRPHYGCIWRVYRDGRVIHECREEGRSWAVDEKREVEP